MVAREGPVRLVELVEQLFDAGEFGGGAAVGEVAGHDHLIDVGLVDFGDGLLEPLFIGIAGRDMDVGEDGDLQLRPDQGKGGIEQYSRQQQEFHFQSTLLEWNTVLEFITFSHRCQAA